MRFTSIVAGIAFIAGATALTTLDSSAVEITEDSIVVVTAQCKDGYFDCITNCPFILPSCAQWPLNCAIIYC